MKWSRMLVVMMAAVGLACGGDSHDDTDPAKQDAGEGGPSERTPVTLASTTPTTSIPTSPSTPCSNSAGNWGDEGDLPVQNVPLYEGSTSVTAMTVRYQYDTYFGEPTQRSVISWEGAGSISNVLWLAEVHDFNGRQYVNEAGQRVYAFTDVGVVKDPGDGFGSNPTGSPMWWETWRTWDQSTGLGYGVSEAESKAIYKACFKLANVKVLKINGNPATK